MTDPGGGVLANTYDTSGRVTRQSDPMGRVANFSYIGDNYSALGGSTTVTDPDGNVTIQRYINGELGSVNRASGTPLAATTSYTYDPATLGVASVTDPLGNVTVHTYDDAGNLLGATDPLNRKTTYTYDPLGDLLSKTTPAGHTTTSRYDARGNLASVADPAARPRPTLRRPGPPRRRRIGRRRRRPGDDLHLSAGRGCHVGLPRPATASSTPLVTLTTPTASRRARSAPTRPPTALAAGPGPPPGRRT